MTRAQIETVIIGVIYLAIAVEQGGAGDWRKAIYSTLAAAITVVALI